MSEPGTGSFRVAYDPERDILRLEYVGRMTRDLILAAADAAFTVPGITERTGMLAVFADAEIDQIDLEALQAFQAYKAAKGYLNLRSAAVLSDKPSDRLMAELWAVTKPGGRAGGAEIFTDEQAAIGWLLGSAPASR